MAADTTAVASTLQKSEAADTRISIPPHNTASAAAPLYRKSPALYNIAARAAAGRRNLRQLLRLAAVAGAVYCTAPAPRNI